MPRTRDVPRVRGGCYLPGQHQAGSAGAWPRYLSLFRPRPARPWTCGISGLGSRSKDLEPSGWRGMGRPTHHPKPVVVPLVVRVVVVAVGAAGVGRFIVEGTPAQHPGAFPAGPTGEGTCAPFTGSKILPPGSGFCEGSLPAAQQIADLHDHF